MTLTKEQRAAVDEGEAIALDVDGMRCVLVRQDVYEQAMLDSQSPRVTYQAVLRALDRDDESPKQYLEYLHE